MREYTHTVHRNIPTYIYSSISKIVWRHSKYKFILNFYSFSILFKLSYGIQSYNKAEKKRQGNFFLIFFYEKNLVLVSTSAFEDPDSTKRYGSRPDPLYCNIPVHGFNYLRENPLLFHLERRSVLPKRVEMSGAMSACLTLWAPSLIRAS